MFIIKFPCISDKVCEIFNCYLVYVLHGCFDG